MGQPGSTAPMMRADEKTLVEAKIELAPLLGDWTNVTPRTDHIARVVMTERDGAVRVRAYGASSEGPVDWGEVEATPHAFTGTSDLAGCHARYAFNGAWTELAANVKLGVLVIQTYTSYDDGSGRLSHFSREFFTRSPAAPTADVERTGFRLVGDWVNTNLATDWIREFTIADTGTALTMRAVGGIEPVDWGEIPISTYTDNIGEPALQAEYDLGSATATLAGNSNMNLIIIAGFIRFKDDESKNFLCREFFARR